MRFSAWRARSRHKDSLSPRVLAVIEPVLTSLGAEPDPETWIVWGEDPGNRYLMFGIAHAGLIQINVRVNVPQEGPRASGKLVRWNRVQTGELGIELVAGHRLVGFQVEGQVLRGSDDEADAIAGFALQVFAAIDGRPYTPTRKARASRSSAGTATTGRSTTKAGRSTSRTPSARSGSGGSAGTAGRLAAPRRPD